MHVRQYLVGLIALLAFVMGCQVTRTAGRRVGEAAIAVPRFLAEGVFNGIFDSDETIVERDQREGREQAWKQHWREHPEDNRAMHEAFKDDYE